MQFVFPHQLVINAGQGPVGIVFVNASRCYYFLFGHGKLL